MNYYFFLLKCLPFFQEEGSFVKTAMDKVQNSYLRSLQEIGELLKKRADSLKSLRIWELRRPIRFLTCTAPRGCESPTSCPSLYKHEVCEVDSSSPPGWGSLSVVLHLLSLFIRLITLVQIEAHCKINKGFCTNICGAPCGTFKWKEPSYS